MVTHAQLVSAINNDVSTDATSVSAVLTLVDTALQEVITKLNSNDPVNSFIFVKTNQYKRVVDKAVESLKTSGFSAETFYKRGVIPELDQYFIKIDLK